MKACVEVNMALIAQVWFGFQEDVSSLWSFPKSRYLELTSSLTANSLDERSILDLRIVYNFESRKHRSFRRSLGKFRFRTDRRLG